MNIQNEILDFFGDATEEMVRNEYTGMSYDEILAALNTMWPSEKNDELARKVFDWLN